MAALAVLGFSAAAHGAAQVLYRINCGGPAFYGLRWVATDADTQAPDYPGPKYLWSADTLFTGGGAYSQHVDIASSADDTLFQTERWNPDPPDGAKYALPVPNAGYTVSFYFAEISPEEAAVGSRVFNVIMNGVKAFSDFDIFAVAGANHAYMETRHVQVTDGMIRIGFENIAHHAKISALMVARDSIPAGSQAPYRVNCGGDDFFDSKGDGWETDRHYFGGSTAATGTNIAGTADQGMIRMERWNDPAKGDLTYSFDLYPGEYTVRLHFAEPWDQDKAVGKRVFNVFLNGNTVLDHFDIFAAAGFAKEIVKEIPLKITGTNGQAIIGFQNIVSEAKIDGIEILPTGTTSVRAVPQARGAVRPGAKHRYHTLLGRRVRSPSVP